MSCGNPLWQLLVEAAEELTARGQTPFTRADLYRAVHRTHPDVGETSMSPIIQGLTGNASGGPRSAAGIAFWRVDRGQYVLVRDRDRAAGDGVARTGRIAPAAPRSPDRWGPQRRRLVDPRVAELIERFDEYAVVYDRQVPFQRSGQYAEHRRVIDRRRDLGTVTAALADDAFLEQVWHVLQRWGIGKRGSRLASLQDFRIVLRDSVDKLEALDGIHLEQVAVGELDNVVGHLRELVATLDIVANKARIVAATKTMHHLLPNLVPPMDRAWTGAFFGWTTLDPQSDQERTFSETLQRFAHVAEQARPSRLVGEGWRTSGTKILDNAVIGYCMEHGLGPAAA